MNVALAIGIIFVALMLLGTTTLLWTGRLTERTHRAYRPYVLVSVFAISMFLTPPDPISQTFLAVPVYLAYEGGLVIARLMFPDKVDSPEGKS